MPTVVASRKPRFYGQFWRKWPDMGETDGEAADFHELSERIDALSDRFERRQIVRRPPFTSRQSPSTCHRTVSPPCAFHIDVALARGMSVALVDWHRAPITAARKKRRRTMTNKVADRTAKSEQAASDVESNPLESSELQQVAGGVWDPPADEFLGVYPLPGCIRYPWPIKVVRPY
jgi:hypothetical protein